MSIYTERTECMMCKSTDLTPLWNNPYTIALGCYVVEDKNHEKCKMPFNILKCGKCCAYQTHYIGNPQIIYNYQAKCHGSIRNTMNELFANFILDNQDINHIMEIGAGNGSISEYILNNKQVKYDIVDPTYSGKEEHRTIYRTFIEDYENNITSDTIIMSHVFEHFYDPVAILDIFKKNETIKYIYLNFPDLERYILEGNYHVLNPEHIFFVENSFIVDLFNNHGFKINRTYYHENHSVFFEFVRTDTEPVELVNKINVNTYFENIFAKINRINALIKEYPSHNTYIWPCSMHTTYLFALGLDEYKITALLDNAPHKIGKYLYGTELLCKPLTSILESNESAIVILNGGCYNKEIINTVLKKQNLIIIDS